MTFSPVTQFSTRNILPLSGPKSCCVPPPSLLISSNPPCTRKPETAQEMAVEHEGVRALDLSVWWHYPLALKLGHSAWKTYRPCHTRSTQHLVCSRNGSMRPMGVHLSLSSSPQTKGGGSDSLRWWQLIRAPFPSLSPLFPHTTGEPPGLHSPFPSPIQAMHNHTHTSLFVGQSVLKDCAF